MDEYLTEEEKRKKREQEEQDKLNPKNPQERYKKLQKGADEYMAGPEWFKNLKKYIRGDK